MLKYFFIIFGLLVITVVSIAGFRGQKFKAPPIEIFPDMDHQPKVKAQKPSGFFADGSATRPPIAATVPLGYVMPQGSADLAETAKAFGPYENIVFSGAPDYVNTGKMGDRWGTGLPFEATAAVMARGKERYTINCAVCHGATGAGNGITSKYGLVGIANLNQARIREMSDGEIFNTITHGKNTMMGYGHNIQVPDRWAIVAYVRAIQRSQGSAIDDVPASERAQLEAQ
ncbi:MAG: c-type cytochrome [Chthoniobacterales bacterium]